MDRATYNRLYWRSRRGMAELELQLLPFFEARFADLTQPQQAAYARLLEFEDWEIYDWLQGRVPAEPGAIADIVSLIRGDRS
jgi:antitoxin CptB